MLFNDILEIMQKWLYNGDTPYLVVATNILSYLIALAFIWLVLSIFFYAFKIVRDLALMKGVINKDSALEDGYHFKKDKKRR